MNFCQGVQIDENVRPARVEDNEINYCKWGLRVMSGKVRAERNLFQYNGVAAMLVGNGERQGAVGGGRLRAEANRLRLNGCYGPSNCQRGGIAVADSPTAWVDAGGGDHQGQPVVCDSDPCPACLCGQTCTAGVCSAGSNILCQDPHRDLWNNPILLARADARNPR